MTLLAEVPTKTGFHIPAWSMGDRLRKAREDANLTQLELAEITTISHTSIKHYEAGRRTPRPLYLRAWSEATGVPVIWLETGNAPTEVEACTCDSEPPIGLEPITCALQGGVLPECPDSPVELLALIDFEAVGTP